MLLRRPLRPRSAQLARGGADLVPPLLMGRLETLLAAILAEDPGRFHASLEAAVQLLKRFALAGVHVHIGSSSRISILAYGRPRVTGIVHNRRAEAFASAQVGSGSWIRTNDLRV